MIFCLQFLSFCFKFVSNTPFWDNEIMEDHFTTFRFSFPDYVLHLIYALFMQYPSMIFMIIVNQNQLIFFYF